MATLQLSDPTTGTVASMRARFVIQRSEMTIEDTYECILTASGAELQTKESMLHGRLLSGSSGGIQGDVTVGGGCRVWDAGPRADDGQNGKAASVSQGGLLGVFLSTLW